jgi:DNA primase
MNLSDSLPHRVRQPSIAPPPSRQRTVSQKQVQQSVERLLHHQGTPQQQALAWLEARGFTREAIEHYRLGLDQRWLTLDENKPDSRECYWSVSIYIPADEPGQFYKKMRVAPWLVGEARPQYVSKWCQYGVPVTIWFTYRPEDAEATWYCEGEWDAMRLGWLARQCKAKIAVCCSTGGCGTVPKQEQLDRIPGLVTIFFDRNDEPRQDGTIPGDEGAKKLALALGERGRIVRVPMPSPCDVKGWDVSNALDAGYTWSDFEAAAEKAMSTAELEQQQAQSEGNKDSQSQVRLTTPANRPVAAFSLRDNVLEILNCYDTPSLRDVALMDLARATGYSYRDVEKLAKSLTIEVDLQTDQIEAAKKLSSLIKTRRTQLDLNRYLEPWFAEVLIETARAMPTAPEFLFTTLLPAAASRVGTAARIIIKPSAKYSQPMVFWTAIVANSGSMKTPAQRVILDPLVALETEAYESYRIDLEDYRAERELSKGKKLQKETPEEPSRPPIRKRYLTKDITLETLQHIHGENPRGLLYYRDELAGNTKARNQYRGGHGADEEAELDQWNGSAILYDRAEKSVCLPRSAVSRTGGYQWEVLAQLMGDHNDFNGSFARWLFCAAKTPLRYLHLLREDRDTGISEALTYLYAELEKVPEQDYLLSYEAMQLLETWQHQLVDAQQSEDAFGLQLVFPKIEAYTARLALWLHIVNAVLRGERPSQMIDGDTMEKAIELAAYYLWQYRLIHTHNSPDSGLAAIALKIQKFVERVGQATASVLKSGVRDLRKMATDQIRQLMQTLANAGYGCVTGEGASMVYVSTLSNASPSGSNGGSDTTSNDQFVNLVAEFPATGGVDSIDAECQLKRQLSTAQTDTSVDDSSQELRTTEEAQMPVQISEESIDTIDRELTDLSVPETEVLQASCTSIDTIDMEVESRHENTAPANLTTDRVAKTEVEQPIAGIDGFDASSEPANGACLSFSSTPSWSGFKVGDSVILSYHQTGGRAWVIDPTQYLELGAQPRPNLVPVRCAYTGKVEWYPANWVRLAT